MRKETYTGYSRYIIKLWYVTPDPGTYDVMIRALKGTTYQFEYVGILFKEKTTSFLKTVQENINTNHNKHILKVFCFFY